MNIIDAIKSAVKKADANFESTFLRGDGHQLNIRPWNMPEELLCSKCKGWGDLVNSLKSGPPMIICIACNGKGIPPIPICELGV